jgi:hypothetical protein
MRLVVWNCAGALARKLAPLMRLHPDVAIIGECARSIVDDPRLRADQVCWCGPDQGRGLAIIGFGTSTVEPGAIAVADRWFLPALVRVAELELRLCAVWVKPAEDYLAPTLRTLEACAQFLTEGAAIVAGDFNHNVSLDKPGRRRRFGQVVEHLGELGLLSAWHRHHAERHGAESRPTFYFRRAPERGFHIDYAFLPERTEWQPRSATLGTYEEWVAAGRSDHVPLIVDAGPPGSPGPGGDDEINRRRCRAAPRAGS